jgi:uncharacterized membrane protein
MNWEIFLGSFAGALIEFVEILGVAIVVGRVAGWRNASIGAGSGIILTAIASLILGKSLTLIPLDLLKIVAGGFLIAFGQKWTRSVVRYYGGILKPKDDEDEQLQQQLEREETSSGWNWFAIVTTFKSALLESLEVAMAIVTLGVTAGKWSEAIAGAGCAGLGLLSFAFLFRHPLNQIPVKLMKFFAAMLLMGFGIYWLVEGLNIHWYTGSLAMIWLPCLWGLLMVFAALILRWRLGEQKQEEAIG